MQNTRLFQLLSTFSAEELQEMQHFVESPFFNRRKEVQLLYKILLPYLQKKKALPEKTTLFNKVFAAKEYDDHRLRMAISFLFQSVCRYLSLRELIQDDAAQKRALSVALRRRGLKAQSIKTLQESRDAQQQSPHRNVDFAEQQYQLLLEQYRLELDLHLREQSDLQGLNNALDEAYLARKLWQSCFALAHQTLYRQSLDYGLLEKVLDYLAERPELLEKPAIAIYFHCYRALTEPADTAHFQRFQSTMQAAAALFPADELRDLFVLALNFCSRQYNAGNNAYLPEQFRLYQEGLERGYFLTEGSLSAYTYQNAATIGIILGETDWVDDFVDRYKAFLPAEQREGLYHFNRARLAYQRRKLGEALALLQKAEYRDLLLHLAARSLQLKIYYESGADRLLESHLAAFQTFLRRRKDLGYHRDNYQHLLYFTQKLIEIPEFDKKARASLRQKIEATPSVAEKEWLLGRCTAYSSSKPHFDGSTQSV